MAAPLRLDLLWTREGRRRRRLAAGVRRRSQEERDHLHHAGVLELDSIRIRTALYETIALRLEDSPQPVTADALEQVEALIAEAPPIRDYGLRAQQRNERIAAVAVALEPADGLR
jgi:hypothetical protein